MSLRGCAAQFNWRFVNASVSRKLQKGLVSTNEDKGSSGSPVLFYLTIRVRFCFVLS